MSPVVLCICALRLAAAPALTVWSDFEPAATPKLVGEGLTPGDACALSTEQRHSGQRAVRLDYDFVANPKALQYAGFSLPLSPLTQLPRGLFVWVYSDGGGEPVRVRLLDAGGECWQFTLGATTETGWQLLGTRLGQGGGHWGGDNNGRLDLPLRFDSLLVDSAVRPAKGSVWFDDLLVEPGQSAPAAPARAAAKPVELSAERFERQPPAPAGENLQAGTRLVRDPAVSHDGQPTWRLDYRFNVAAGLQYVEVPLDFAFDPPGGQFRLWVRGDGSRNFLRLRLVDSTGEYHQPLLGTLEFNDFKHIGCSLDAVPGSHWGGDNNGRLDGRTRVVSLVLDAGVKPSAGSIWLAQASATVVLRPADAVTVKAALAEPGRVLAPGERPTWTVTTVDRRLAGGAAPVVQLALERPDGTSVPAVEGTPLSERYGLYRLVPTWTVDGDTARGAGVTWCVLPPMPETDVDTNPFGVCLHYGQRKGQLPRNYDLLRRIGGRWARDEYGWGAIERKRGQYVFGDYLDRMMAGARGAQVQPLHILDYANALYDGGRSPATPEAQQAFAAYAFAMVSKYKDVCNHWEVYNEPNIGFWKPKPDAVAYASLLKLTYEACKRADPTCTVVGVCTAGTDLKYIETVLQHDGAKFMDALSIHPYHYPTPPESGGFVGQLQRCRALMNRFGMDAKPLWLTEIGWPNHVGAGGSSEQASADCLVRMVSLARSQPGVGPIVWYDFQNDGLNTAYNEDNFGLFNLDFTPKQPFVAAAMMNRVLAGKRFVKDHHARSPVYAHEYADADGQRTLVLWATPFDTDVTLRLDATEVELSDANGDLRTVPVTGGGLTLTATETPRFVTGRFANAGVSVP